MKKTYCLVIGVGPGTGSACVRRFMDGGYSASMISRNQERLEEFAADMPGATLCGRYQSSGRISFHPPRSAHEHGMPKAIIYNATQATFGHYTEVELGKFERNFG